MADRFRRASYVMSGASAPAMTSGPTGAPANVVKSSGQWRAEIVDVTRGRITLAALNAIILMMVVFYIYTRGVQGGG